MFIGGGADATTIERAWAALRPGGRIVVHTVTLDTEQTVIAAMRRHGGELRLSDARQETTDVSATTGVVP